MECFLLLELHLQSFLSKLEQNILGRSINIFFMPDSLGSASITHKSYGRSLTDSDLKPGEPSLAKHTHTHSLGPIRPIDQSLTTLWGDKFIEEAGQFVFMVSVARSWQDSERVHVHLMVHERTMAAAEWALFLRGTGAIQASLQRKSMAGQLKPKSMSANWTAVNYVGFFWSYLCWGNSYFLQVPLLMFFFFSFFLFQNWLAAVAVQCSSAWDGWKISFKCKPLFILLSGSWINVAWQNRTKTIH